MRASPRSPIRLPVVVLTCLAGWLGAAASHAQTQAPPPPPPPPGQPGQPAPPSGPAAPRRPPVKRRGPPPVYSLVSPAAAGTGQTVIVRGRNFPRRRRAVVTLDGRPVASAVTNSIGNFAAGFLVGPDWRRGVGSLVSQAGGRRVISRMLIVSGGSRAFAVMTASTGATLTVSPTRGPPGTRVRVLARGLAPKQPVGLTLAGSGAASGRASASGGFARYLRIPALPGGRRELKLYSGRLAMASYVDIYPSPGRRLAPGRVSLAAAGDIACQPGQPQTFGTCRYADTARLLGYLNPRVIATLGDYQYFTGSIATSAGAFDGTWGLYKSRTRPALGDHEYQQPGASGYFTYFGAAAGPPNGWYSYDIGSWHVVVLNSECPRYVSCDFGSPQEQWLRGDLAAHRTACTLAYWSEPRFTSAGRSQNPFVAPLWQALYDYGVEVVLNADAHIYERFAPQNPSGNYDPGRGIRQFTVGSGGKDLGRFVRVAPNSERRLRSFGVLALRLLPGSYRWQFVPITGYHGRDAGSSGCH